MAFTVAEARGLKFALMHCSQGHTFRLSEAHKDRHGTWCPQCGNGAASCHRSLGGTHCSKCAQPKSK